MNQLRVGGLVKNAIALIVSGTGSAVIGVVFWGVATHRVSAATIGRTSAEIAAMTLLAQLAQLGLGTVLERFLPIAGSKTHDLVLRIYAICTILALVLSVSYVALGIGRSFLPQSLTWQILFVTSVLLWTVFTLQDSVLVGLRATRWVPVENIIYSLAKLLLVPVLVLYSASQGVLLAWLLPVVVLIAIVNWYLFRNRIPKNESPSLSTEELPTSMGLIKFAFAQYASLLVIVVSNSIATLIVIGRLGAVASAHYYIPSQIAGGATIVIWSIMRSFVVEATTMPDRLEYFARVTLRTTFAMVAPSVLVGFVIAPSLLNVFGRSYAVDGSTLLRMLLLTLPAVAVTSFYSAFAELDKRLWLFATRQIASAVIYFTTLLLMIGSRGILATGYASLVSSGAQAVFFLPLLVRRYRKAAGS